MHKQEDKIQSLLGDKKLGTYIYKMKPKTVSFAVN